MVSKELSEGITETLDILNHMNVIDVRKIPKKFMNFLENNKSNSYLSNLDHSKKIEEMNLKEKTKDLLTVIYLKYWCEGEKKEQYMNLLVENEKKHQEEIIEKYNTDNLFEKKAIKIEKEENTQENTSLVEVKENFFTKFINMIKNLFHL